MLIGWFVFQSITDSDGKMNDMPVHQFDYLHYIIISEVIRSHQGVIMVDQ